MFAFQCEEFPVCFIIVVYGTQAGSVMCFQDTARVEDEKVALKQARTEQVLRKQCEAWKQKLCKSNSIT